MQLELNLCFLLLAIAAVKSVSMTGSQCGYVEEDLLLRKENNAVPTEHQWMARIFYENGRESEIPNEGCLGVLISKRNVLAPAHCFLQYNGRTGAYSVQLGVWNKSSNAHDVSCNSDGFCVLPAQDIPLAGIAIHPEYDSLRLTHNLAVLTLQDEVRLTPNVMPVCMPSETLANKTLVGELLIVAGLPIKGEIKHKALVNTISRPFCQKEYSPLVTSSTTICGYHDRTKLYYAGAPLVGIQVKSDKPQNFFLAGIMLDSKEFNDADQVVASFLDVRPYLEFINRNAESLTIIN